MRHHTTQTGIALYIAIIIASIVTFISFAVSNVAFRQVQLAQVGEKSQYAFYAANSAVECVMYWDTKEPGVEFATSSNSKEPWANDSSDGGRDKPVNCNNNNDDNWGDVPAASDTENATTTFVVNDLGPDADDGDAELETCAKVTVGKHAVGSSDSDDDIMTIVRAKGRSNMDDCTISEADVPEESVERSIRVSY